MGIGWILNILLPEGCPLLKPRTESRNLDYWLLTIISPKWKSSLFFLFCDKSFIKDIQIFVNFVSEMMHFTIVTSSLNTCEATGNPSYSYKLRNQMREIMWSKSSCCCCFFFERKKETVKSIVLGQDPLYHRTGGGVSYPSRFFPLPPMLHLYRYATYSLHSRRRENHKTRFKSLCCF